MRSGGARTEAGETLTEVLVTIVILGIAVAGISAALLVTNRTSALHRQQALAQGALRAWAEQVAAGSYTACATASTFPPPSPALPAGLTPAVTGVQYWNGTAFAASCGTDTGIQRVTLRITATTGRTTPLTDSVAVVVRKPCVSSC